MTTVNHTNSQLAGLTLCDDAELYSKGNAMQCALFRYVTQVMPVRWRTGDVVLDVGCGTGEVNRLMLENNDRIKSMLGVDISPSFVVKAKLANTDDRFEAVVGDAAGQWPEEWNRRFSKIVSFTALHYVSNQSTFLRNAFNALRPGGSIYLVFVSKFPSLELAIVATLQHPKWNTFFPRELTALLLKSGDWKQPEAYLSLLKEAGFVSRQVALVPFEYQFASDEDELVAFKAVNYFTKLVPNHLRDEFERDFTDQLQSLEEAHSGHRLSVELTNMVITATRPQCELIM